MRSEMGRNVASILILSPAPGSPEPEVHCGNLKRKNSLEEGWRLPFSQSPSEDREGQGAGWFLHTRSWGHPSKSRRRDSCQEPLPGRHPGSLTRPAPPMGAGPQGASDPRVLPKLCPEGDRNSMEALCFVHSEPLCLLSPYGF